MIENIVIVENPENLENIPINHVLNLGPPPVLQRNNPPVYFGADAEELLADGQLQEYVVPHDFVMPTQLAFEEEMDLPPPRALSRISNIPLFDEEWRDVEFLPQPLTRCYTNAHLLEDNDEEQDNEEQDNEEQDNEEQENEEQDK